VAWLLIHKLQTVNVDTQAFIHTITQLTDWVRTQTSYDLFDQKNISSVASILPSIGQFLMGGISSFTVNIGVLIIVLYFMLIGGKRMEQYIYEILPFNEENKKEVLTEIHLLVRSNAIGIPLLAVIQGMIASLGYYLFDAPSVLLFGFLTCFATIIPIVGTALVWIPLAAYMAISGDWPHALGLVLYCGLIVTNIDNLIRFILQSPTPLTTQRLKRVIFEGMPQGRAAGQAGHARVGVTVRQNLPVILHPKGLAPNRTPWTGLTWSLKNQQLSVHNPTPYVVRLAQELKLLPGNGSALLPRTYVLPGETLSVAASQAQASTVQLQPATVYGFAVDPYQAPITL
jgi:hypothetical protein